MNKKILLGFCVFVLAIISLVYTVAYRESHSVLLVSTCKLPCWNNITPGVTTLLEARQIIETTAGSSDVFYDDYLHTMDFSMDLDKLGIHKASGEIAVSGGVVTGIWLSGDLGIQVEEIFALTGTPDNIISTHFGGGGITFAGLYPEKGIVFWLSRRETKITPQTKIDTIGLFELTSYEQLLNDGRIAYNEVKGKDVLKLFYPWKGYGDIKELYPPNP